MKEYKENIPPVLQSIEVCGGCGAYLDGSEGHMDECPNYVEVEEKKPALEETIPNTGHRTILSSKRK